MMEVLWYRLDSLCHQYGRISLPDLTPNDFSLNTMTSSGHYCWPHKTASDPQHHKPTLLSEANDAPLMLLFLWSDCSLAIEKLHLWQETVLMYVSFSVCSTAGMNMSPVSRLKKTWSKVKTAKFDILEVCITSSFGWVGWFRLSSHLLTD